MRVAERVDSNLLIYLSHITFFKKYRFIFGSYIKLYYLYKVIINQSNVMKVSENVEFNGINKKTSTAFNKKVYLLGVDNNDRYRWLEAPSWDCGWYWGFGYIEEYTNHTNPILARDITSHTHWNSTEDELIRTVFSEDEYKELCTLFEDFYQKRIYANALHNVNEDEWNRLNKEVIPEITKQIINILDTSKK